MTTTAPDGGQRTLHVRCGTDIRDALKEAGFTGDFLAFVDPVCQGPVVAGDGYLERRVEFIAANYGGEPDAVRSKLTRQYRRLRAAPSDYERIVLWFEHDSFDQLILARLLSELAGRHGAAVSLICIDRFAGVEPFRGLGQLSPLQLRSLWEKRVSVAPDHTGLARRVWDALCEPDPRALYAIARSATDPIPPMASALVRHLQELPFVASGLSLSQRLIVEALLDGPLSAGRLFAEVQHRLEPLPFLGDLMFWPILETLAGGAAPLVQSQAESGVVEVPDRVYAVTRGGRAALEGEFDWLTAGPPVRWVGGVCVDGAKAWRWCPSAGAPTTS